MTIYNTTLCAQDVNCKSIAVDQFPFFLFHGKDCAENEYVLIQDSRTYEVFSDDYRVYAYRKIQGFIPIYYMYMFSTEAPEHSELIALKDNAGTFFEVSPIHTQISHIDILGRPPRRTRRTEFARGCLNLMDCFEIPKRSATYSIWMEYCGLKSNVSEITILYRPYPRDIYAVS